MRRLRVVATLLATAVPAVAQGQRFPNRLSEASRPSALPAVTTSEPSASPWTPASPGLWPAQPPDSGRRAPLWAILASGAVPGVGQAVLGQDRVIAYLAVEAYAWARYYADVREGRRARNSYRDLASQVARRAFSTVRPVGDFDYYERMEKYMESGTFDVLPGGELDPEPDTTTANGATWLLARETYWADPFSTPPRDSPEYTRAETFYRERAIRPEFQWSWRGAQLEYAEFRRTIRRSNNAYRTSLQDLGIIIANHTLSTVDAFITVRLRRDVGRNRTERYHIEGSIPLRLAGVHRE